MVKATNVGKLVVWKLAFRPPVVALKYPTIIIFSLSNCSNSSFIFNKKSGLSPLGPYISTKVYLMPFNVTSYIKNLPFLSRYVFSTFLFTDAWRQQATCTNDFPQAMAYSDTELDMVISSTIMFSKCSTFFCNFIPWTMHSGAVLLHVHDNFEKTIWHVRLQWAHPL